MAGEVRIKFNEAEVIIRPLSPEQIGELIKKATIRRMDDEGLIHESLDAHEAARLIGQEAVRGWRGFVTKAGEDYPYSPAACDGLMTGWPEFAAFVSSSLARLAEAEAHKERELGEALISHMLTRLDNPYVSCASCADMLEHEGAEPPCTMKADGCPVSPLSSEGARVMQMYSEIVALRGLVEASAVLGAHRAGPSEIRLMALMAQRLSQETANKEKEHSV